MSVTVPSPLSNNAAYKIYEKDHAISHEFWGGYIRHNQIRREVYNVLGEKIEDEYVCENHALMMYEPLLDYDERKENG